MEEVKNEEVTEEVIQEEPKVEAVEEQVVEPDLEKFESKDDPDVIKVDLSKPPEPETVDEVETNVEETNNEVAQEEDVDDEAPALEEVTDEEVTEELFPGIEAKEISEDLPENVQKLIDFMDETGGDLQDYVNLNRDVKDLDDQDALLEYYKRTKPHLDSGEINFLMEDNFSFDEEVDDERDIKRKKLALKEQVAEAKTYLDGQKSKYYEEIKAGSKLTGEQQKAIDFFNRHNKESEQTQKMARRQEDVFNKKTEQVFSNEFKGFEYDVAGRKYRVNVNDASSVKQSQSDLNNFVGKFLNKDHTMNDAKGYHKSLYTAMNADAVANHFYEQGKADALKDSVAKAKNINTSARSTQGEVPGGMKVRVLGDDSASFKFKIKNKNKN